MGTQRRARKSVSELRKRPRQARSAATFAAIVEAAARILGEQGAARLNTNSVAARAGVSVGSLYQYFPGKQAIVRALAERELARAEALRPPALDDPDAPLAARVRAAVDWRFGIHAAHPTLARVLASLVNEVMSPAERERFAARRLRRVRRTLASRAAPGLRGRDLDQLAFIVDTCLGALTEAAAERRPAWLADECFRAEVASMLARHLEEGSELARVSPAGSRGTSR